MQYRYHGRSDTAFTSIETRVFEYADVSNSFLNKPVSIKVSHQPWIGRGSVQVEGYLRSPLAISGQEVRIDLKILNNSTKKVQGIKLYLYRSLESLSNISHRSFEQHEIQDYAPLLVKNSEFFVNAHETRHLASTIKIPTGIYTVCKAVLGEVNCWIQVSLGMGLFNSDIILTIPVAIYDPLSLLPIPNYNDTNALDRLPSSSKDWENISSSPRNIPIKLKSSGLSRSLSPKRYGQGNPMTDFSPPNRSLPWTIDFDDARSDDGISFSDSRNI